MTKFTFHSMTLEEIAKDPKKCPFPLEMFTNHLGIPLHKISYVDWTIEYDETLKSFEVHFRS